MNSQSFFQKLEDDGLLRDELASIGWAFWPFDQDGRQRGFFDENLLRSLADEIERRNAPFWQSYFDHHREEYGMEGDGQLIFPFYFDKGTP